MSPRSSSSSPSSSSAAPRKMIKSRKPSSASAPVDKYYGQKDLAEFCEFIITDMFSPAGVDTLHRTSGDAVPPPTSENVKEPPALVLFIAYALYRTRLPTTIIHHALYLLHRLKARYPSARGTSSSPHRLFLSALMLSSKIQMDDTYSNRSWAIVGGNFFALREVNQMERELFAFLEWNAVVSKAELEAYSETIDADWAFVKTRHGLQAARARTAPIPSTSTEQPVIGKRRRSDTTYTEQAIEKAQALRHKRAADAAIALLQPTQGTAASYRDQINSRYGQEASQESSVCSSFVSSPSSDKFFQYNSSSSYGTSPETSSPHSSKGGPITPEDHETLSRFSNSVNVADISLPPSRQPSWSALIHAKNSLPKSFTYSAGGIMSNVSA